MELSNIIIKPYHTEKSYGLRKFQDPSCLVFVVNSNASKDVIKLAFYAIYNVMPKKVNIVNKKPKKLRMTNAGFGYSKATKLAYITLPKGVQIALTKDEIEEAAKSGSKKVEKPVKETSKPKKEKVNDIPVGQKHQIVSMDEFEKYDYDKRRKDWHKKAGHNDKQVVCSCCKDDDNWATVKLENGKHLCYYCWIKKPENSKPAKKVETKPAVVKKAAPAKKAKASDIPVGQKHEVVSLKDFEKYNYDKRRKDWHKKAGHNDKQVVCSICKDDDNWASVKLENGKHVCYYCWIKKPETLASMKSNKK